MKFTLHTPESAPSAAAEELKKSIQAFGILPNLHAVLANSPETLSAYKQLHELFQKSSFDAAELTVVWQTINRYHACHYCLPAHTAIAHSMKVDKDIIEALHKGDRLNDTKLETLRQTTLALVDSRGKLSDEQKQAFEQQGYGPQQLLEIVLGIAQKTISNYTNHLADTEVDAPFKKFV